MPMNNYNRKGVAGVPVDLRFDERGLVLCQVNATTVESMACPMTQVAHIFSRRGRLLQFHVLCQYEIV